MTNKFLLCLFGWIVLLSTAACSTQTTTDVHQEAKQGSLDLRNWDMETKETVHLDGEWLFQWNEFQDPENDYFVKPEYINTPGSWHNKMEEDQLPHRGYATYRLRVLLPDNDNVLGLYIPSISTAYKMWVDGELLASNGKVGTNHSEMEPRHYPQIVYFQAESSEMDIVIHVSDFHQRKAGWANAFQLGSPEAIQQLREQKVAKEIIFVVSLAVMALYHFGLYLLRPQDRSALYFGGICAAVAVRTLLLGEVLLIRFAPWINWEFSLKLEYWGASFGMIFLILFIQSQYKKEMQKGIRNLLLGALTGFSIFILFTPARIFTEAMVLLQLLASLGIAYLIYVLFKALIRKRKGAVLHAVAMSVLFVFVINDILYYNQIVSTGETVSLGLFIYLFAQSFHLSSVFTDALTQSEKLSSRLKNINQTLEEKVHERTKKLVKANNDLKEANARLSKMHKTRRELMSNISHELNTPLTSIQGYVKAMLDNIVDRSNPKYLHLVYNKTIFLGKIIEDLRELAKLESGTISYQFEKTYIVSFIQNLASTYQSEIEKTGLQMIFINNLPGKERDFLVSIDQIRIEQVFTNLLFNAKKFTPSDGQIIIELALINDDKGNEAGVFIHDTGTGINKDDLPYVFHRFYRGGVMENRKGEGVGLGLAISKEIIRGHGGTIGVNSEERQGSTFYFTFSLISDPSSSLVQMHKSVND
ncbi:cell wall metabolism sensor histidine kinase WalK [Alteribacillus sp. YIM 98480]|uniref:sensor histidine kinase n=1 Tax=Alteribacillus sp. YIM 98480 TaxID=2606599 RepID=UPI00131D0F73|nr:7TM diverse intracellular signaling domain-containing protein [Alteribacillus sp. YIM 98480]